MAQRGERLRLWRATTLLAVFAAPILLRLAGRLTAGGRASARFVESSALSNPIRRSLDGLVILHPRSQGAAQCCDRRHQPGHHQQG